MRHRCRRLKPLGQVIGAFKTRSTKEVNQLRGTPGAPLWQRDYGTIHDEYELARVREYIRSNPANYRPRMYRIGVARERPRDDIVE